MLSALWMYWYWAVPALLLAVWIAYRQLRPRSDIQWATLDANLQWGSAPDDALGMVYTYVLSFSTGTIQWYQRSRRPKRIFGQALRVGALLATAAAGLVPLSKYLFNYTIEPAWSTVLVAAAGVFVSLDSLGGFTSGWVRYMLAQQKVERLRDGFLLEWNILKAAQTNASAMLDRAKLFLLGVGKVVDDETQDWATEFQNALKEMEKVRKAAADTERTGAIEVTVKNPEVVAAWTLEIDGSQRGRTSGKSMAITDVLVGLRKLRAYGQDAQGKTFSDEKTVKVEGGATIAKEMELT